jgi:hypothetical protein
MGVGLPPAGRSNDNCGEPAKHDSSGAARAKALCAVLAKNHAFNSLARRDSSRMTSNYELALCPPIAAEVCAIHIAIHNAVTAEVASSSLVVPAIFSKSHMRERRFG